VIHLHIGRHKTGTSSLQHFLARNRDALAGRGFTYPASIDGAAGHHALARTLNTDKPSPGRVARAGNPQEVERFAAFGAEVGHLIVSSEGFQSVDPAAVRALWPDREVQVIIYLREPLSYLLSSYAQAVHARAIRTPLVRHAASFRPDYPGFVSKWAQAFGRDAIRLRLYEREQLREQDIRRDFLDLLNIEADGLDFSQPEANPSLSPELIEFKGMVNAVLPMERQSALRLYPVLSRVASGFSQRLRAGAAFSETYRSRFREANAQMLQAFPESGLQPFHEPVSAEPTPPVDLLQVRDAVLEAVTRRAPGVGRALRDVLPEDPSGLEPLLPQDWALAAESLQAAWSGA
jgi:hypothetical protein